MGRIGLEPVKFHTTKVTEVVLRKRVSKKDVLLKNSIIKHENTNSTHLSDIYTYTIPYT